jgi:endonuclease/exonuclease/phosphatase family metal-dependent hydrolase
VEHGAKQVSSDVQLTGTAGRPQGKLAIRSMAWLKLKKNNAKHSVYVICTHLSGGRFEDQYFAQQLSNERRLQTERALDFFKMRQGANCNDVGILVGDFNATTEYTEDGPMHGYFKSAIASSAGVHADASAAGLKHDHEVEALFKDYMVSPFSAIKERGWNVAYSQSQVGPTSGFGHLIDHMATSHPLRVVSAEAVYFTNQKFGNKPKDTELPLTDHNAVRAIFAIPGASSTEASRQIMPQHTMQSLFADQQFYSGMLQQFRTQSCTGPWVVPLIDPQRQSISPTRSLETNPKTQNCH